MSYNFKLKKLVLSCAVVVSANYLVVFVLLIVFYYKILQRIKRMRTQGSKREGRRELFLCGTSCVIHILHFAMTIFRYMDGDLVTFTVCDVMIGRQIMIGVVTNKESHRKLVQLLP